jgi:hypothetical protein
MSKSKLTREMQVSTAEFRTLHVDWKKNLAASAQVLDIAIATLATHLLAFMVFVQQKKDEIPCSGRPGMVRAPSLPTFVFISSVALPA